MPTVVLLRLESSLGAPRPRGADKLKIMRRIQRRLAGMKPLNDAFLDRAKREGRVALEDAAE